MMWNFDYIIPTFVVLAFFLIFYFLKPVYLTRSNRCFFILVLSEIVGFVLESYSCHIDINCDLYHKNFIIFINTISLIAFAVRYYIVSIYLINVYRVHLKNDFIVKILFFCFLIISALIITNPWTNFLYTFTSAGNFISQKYYFVFYISCAIPLLAQIYYIIRFGKKRELFERILISLSLAILLISCIIKYFYENYLITDAFFIFVIMGFFFVFENPANMIDRRTGLLNFTAFNEIITEYTSEDKNFSIISFTIKNYNEKRQIYGSKQSEVTLREIGKFFLTLSHFRKCFYLRNGNFVILEKNNKNFPRLKKIVSERFEQQWNINNSFVNIDIIIVDMENDVKFSSLDDIAASFGFSFSDAKQLGINSITITKDSLEKTSRRTKVHRALSNALTNNTLQVYYQPIVEAKTRKVVAAEALVRIIDEELGVIPPVEFITMAEKNGSIEQLGEQVLSKVCSFIKGTNINKYGVEWINVNLSPIQCQNKDLQRKIDNITFEVNHKQIHLEITEESIIDSEVLKKQMNLLIVDGYKFSLDDFGAGFSNVSRVKMFPFNNIKLDMGIVWEHFKNPDDILPSVVKSFNNRGLTVTAEGVETKEMADSLEEMGCNFLQGYYFSKPIPAKDFEDYIKESFSNNKL